MNKKILLTGILSLAICFTVKTQSLDETMTVAAGTAVSIASGTTLNASNVNLKSTSDKYACLLLNGDIGSSTIVNYDRYVNVVGTSGVNGGNDLVSLPVKAAENVTFSDLLSYSADEGVTPNSDIIVNSPSVATLYGFGPYDNVASSYINYDSAQNGTTVLNKGVGYRAATDTGQTLRFTGKVSNTTETVDISTGGNYWNLVGNPNPTYLNSQTFLNVNESILDDNAVAIYGYNSGTESGIGTIGNFTIINRLTHLDVNIAPGQGFFVANKGTSTNTLSFTTAMRTIEGTDDFILGRDSDQNYMLRLKAERGTANFATEIYFNNNSTSGLDPGYDAALFSGTASSFLLYSQLVDNNVGRNMAIQSLGLSNLNDINIPIGIKTTQGQQVTFSIENSTLPTDVDIYLEDNQNNTFTLLNSENYSFTANTAINGTGRFFLRFSNSTLSTNNQESSSLALYTSERIIHINGLLLADSKVSVYDVQGRLVLTGFLAEGSDTNTIDASYLRSGVYIVNLNGSQQLLNKKIIIN